MFHDVYYVNIQNPDNRRRLVSVTSTIAENFQSHRDMALWTTGDLLDSAELS